MSLSQRLKTWAIVVGLKAFWLCAIIDWITYLSIKLLSILYCGNNPGIFSCSVYIFISYPNTFLFQIYNTILNQDKQLYNQSQTYSKIIENNF